MDDDTRRLLVGVGGVLAAVLVGSLVATTVTRALSLPPAYAQGVSVGFITPAIVFTSLARSDFDRRGYYRDRGRNGIAADALLVGAVGLVGGLVGAFVTVLLGLGGTLGLLVPFGLGVLGGSALFIARNRAYYPDR